MTEQQAGNDSTDKPPAPRGRRPLALWIAALAAAVLAVGGGVAAAVANQQTGASVPTASATPQVNTAGFPQGGSNPGIFTDRCATTVTAADDPIMMPGMTGMSMQHDFFGNTKPSASSEPANLVGGSTSCSTSADASAYWLPVVYQNGAALKPSSALIYWRAPAASAASVATMPAGISMIAGDEGATAPQSARVVDWTCTPGASKLMQKAANTPHDCPAGHDLRLVITFPNCWDGHTLDGRSRENVAYAGSDGKCPSSHPVQIPQIIFHVAYPTTSGSGITLSTGPSTQGAPVTGHADFMNGWAQARMDANVAACIDTQTRCGPTSGTDATPKGGRDRPMKAGTGGKTKHATRTSGS